jgi:hypothetical protein
MATNFPTYGGWIVGTVIVGTVIVGTVNTDPRTARAHRRMFRGIACGHKVSSMVVMADNV